MQLGRLAFVGAVLLALAWFALRGPVAVADPRFIKQDFVALGTLVSVSLYLEEGVPRERGQELIADCEKFLRAYEQTWSPSGTGLLGEINRTLAGGQTFLMSGPSAALFVRAEEARRRSGGLFDARLGTLVRLWGFDDDTHRRSEPPPAADIQRLVGGVQRAGDFREGNAYGPAPEVQWDFGGIAKGAAVEEAVGRFKAAGVRNVIVNAGGNLRTAGTRGTAPWRIGVRHPRGTAPDEVIAYLLADTDEAVMTSGDYERYFEHGGRRYHHILDPRTGAPAEGLQSVTVVHGDAAWADAASTALFVAGEARWRETAAALGIEQALAVTGAGEIVVTERLNQRLKFLHGHKPRPVP